MHPPIFITHPKRHLQPFWIELPSMQHSACSVRSGDPWRFTSTSRNRGASKEPQCFRGTPRFASVLALFDFGAAFFPTIGSNACRDQADQQDQCGLQSFWPQEFIVATYFSFLASHDCFFSMKAAHTLQCVWELIASVVETSEADGVLHASSIHHNS